MGNVAASIGPSETFMTLNKDQIDHLLKVAASVDLVEIATMFFGDLLAHHPVMRGVFHFDSDGMTNIDDPKEWMKNSGLQKHAATFGKYTAAIVENKENLSEEKLVAKVRYRGAFHLRKNVSFAGPYMAVAKKILLQKILGLETPLKDLRYMDSDSPNALHYITFYKAVSVFFTEMKYGYTEEIMRSIDPTKMYLLDYDC